MPNFKLIGGALNGVIIAIPNALGLPPSMELPVTDENEDVVSRERYTLQYLSGSRQIHPFYARHGMDLDEVIQRLLS